MTRVAAFIIFFAIVTPAFALMTLHVFRLRTRGATIWGAVTVLGAVGGLALEAVGQLPG